MEEPDAGQSASGSLPLVAGGSSAKTGTRVFQSARRSKGQPGVGFDANTIRHSGIGRAGRAGPSASGSLPGGGSSADGCRTITRRRKALTTQGLDANTILHSKEASPTHASASGSLPWEKQRGRGMGTSGTRRLEASATHVLGATTLYRVASAAASSARLDDADRFKVGPDNLPR